MEHLKVAADGLLEEMDLDVELNLVENVESEDVKAGVDKKALEKHIRKVLREANKKNADKNSKKMYFIVKRTIDILCSSIAIILLSPIFIITAIAIKLESKGPVFYVQERVGKNGKIFNIYKFRSMCDGAHDMVENLQHLNEREGTGFKISNDPRVTKVGKIIRKTCIDELPQLFNIFFSEMSIVGPRPPLPEEVAEYTDSQIQRLGAKPGLTCYWQVSDRDMEFDDWANLDIKYIKESSLLLDIKLIFKTFGVVFSSKGDH